MKNKSNPKITRQTIESLLIKLPHKLQVSFALYCAKDAAKYDTDKAGTNCIRLVEKWLADENSVTTEELYTSAAAMASATAATTAASYAAYYAAYYASASAASYATASAGIDRGAAYYTAYTSNEEKELLRYYGYLINDIANLSELEKILWEIE